jgi:putative endopeptidase
LYFQQLFYNHTFFNLEAEDAVNYGGIGAVIGHEIGHGLTIKEVFDGEGVMRNWWTPQDLTSFKAKTKSLVDQYSAFKVFPI